MIVFAMIVLVVMARLLCLERDLVKCVLPWEACVRGAGRIALEFPRILAREELLPGLEAHRRVLYGI